MEKINTPLLQIIHEKKKQIKSLEEQVEKLHQMSYVADRILECRNKIDMIKNDIQFLESYLPSERNIIEKAFEYGQDMIEGVSHEWREDLSGYEYQIRNTMGAKTYFTQTFKSYE